MRSSALLPASSTRQNPSPGGAVVIFDWVETLRDLLSRADYDPSTSPETGGDGPPSSAAAGSIGDDGRGDDKERAEEEEGEDEPLEAEQGDSEDAVEIFHGQAFTDRRSTFQAHLARVSSENQVWDQVSGSSREGDVGVVYHVVVFRGAAVEAGECAWVYDARPAHTTSQTPS